MSSYLNWHVGMKVVCVEAVWKGGPKNRKGIRFPVAEQIYTIREMFASPVDGDICIRLSEIHNPIKPSYLGPFEAAFKAKRFRPLVTRKTDISIFTAMLHSTDQTVDA